MPVFSQQPRCQYGKNQLAEVICQLRFPEILSIGTTAPAAFQDLIREEYPAYMARKESPAPKITGTPGSFSLENQPLVVNYQFTSEDQNWRVNLTSRFLSLACSNYTGWEEFAQRLDQPLAAFITTYKPAYFERVGLRYINFISRQDLGLSGTPFSELIAPCYLGLLADEEVEEQSASRSSVDTEMAIRGGCRVKLHAGPGLVKRAGQTQQDREVKFVFDQDLFMPGKVPVNLSAGALETLHTQADAIFRGAILDELHRAMEPEVL